MWRSLETLRDDAEQVIVWHRYNGCMVTNAFHAKWSPFYLCWREAPDRWFDPRERKPMAPDADFKSCVLVVTEQLQLSGLGVKKREEMGIMQFSRVTENEVLRWAPMPPAPGIEAQAADAV